MYRRIGDLTRTAPKHAIAAELAAAKIPHAEINTIAATADIEAVRARLNRTLLPGGRSVRLPPAAVDLAGLPRNFAPPPRYGEHTRAILSEIGSGADEIERLYRERIVA